MWCNFCSSYYDKSADESAGEIAKGIAAIALNVFKSKGTNLLKPKSECYTRCPECGGYHWVCPHCQNYVPSSPGHSGEEIVCDSCHIGFVPFIR